MRLWERVAETGEAVTICEDDALLHRDFASLSSDLLGSLEPDWDFTTWGWNFDSVLVAECQQGGVRFGATFDQDFMRAESAAYRRSSVNPGLLKLRSFFGTFCYSISPKGAARFIELAKPPRLDVSLFTGGSYTPGPSMCD